MFINIESFFTMQISLLISIILTVLCYLSFFYLKNNNIRYFFIPYNPKEKKFFGAMFDFHSVSHFYFGFLFCILFGFFPTLLINICWELWDYYKPTTYEKTSNEFYNFIKENFLVSEGRFDVLDFSLMLFGSLFALILKF